MTASSGQYLSKEFPIDDALCAHLSERDGEARLRIEVYYHRDARPRGIILSINRIRRHDMGYVAALGHSTGFYRNVRQLERKSDKVGNAIGDAVERNVDEIVRIATASDKPDWQQIINLVSRDALTQAA